MFAEKNTFYDTLVAQADALIADESDLIANMANISALLFLEMPDLNWAGFYILRNNELVLGPFQGKPACVRIAVGKGVCGTAVATGDIQLVRDVHEFPGHIACDAASNSEIVLPVRHAGQIIAVLDIDSPSLARFDQADAAGLARIVQVFEQRLEQTQ
ncbi:MAG: GAF domain-containing protein [Gammaproteobacteria bacterium]|jgi:L-methionine (R)-S-oxide reductase|nr:GAF domain-containing protein [Gammaproteobacteria bacterium]